MRFSFRGASVLYNNTQQSQITVYKNQTTLFYSYNEHYLNELNITVYKE